MIVPAAIKEEQHGHALPLAAPQLGSRASSGRAWRLWAASGRLDTSKGRAQAIGRTAPPTALGARAYLAILAPLAAQVLVCGTDGFVDLWAGAIERVYDESGKKKKVQGAVRGILKAVGFTEDMVYKY